MIGNSLEPMTTLHDFGHVLGWPLDTSFQLSHSMVTTLAFVCEVALRASKHAHDGVYWSLSQEMRRLSLFIAIRYIGYWDYLEAKLTLKG